MPAPTTKPIVPHSRKSRSSDSSRPTYWLPSSTAATITVVAMAIGP